ncbi:TRAP transporter small permease [Roseimarinus sediminis]|jgi:TRAP-type C4-dicarboxylate transport system permease small subunit|uniref:TRAP transporter small permease n=1 Tax=Roseimarinus sediminis TaxID=1610899 RepID=UPI003D1C9F97
MTIREKIDKILEYAVIIFLSVLVIDVLWQVISRYVFASPSSFTDELAGFLLIWVGMLGAAYVHGKQEHLAIDLLLQRSSPERQRVMIIIINLVILLFAVLVLVVGGLWLSITRFQLDVASSALRLPLGYVYLVLPISGLLMAYYSNEIIRKNIKKKK